MPIRSLLIGVTAFLLACAAPVFAGELYVIAHDSVSVSVADVRDVFIGDKQIAGNVKLVPIDNIVVQKEFLERVVKISTARYDNVWTKKGFRDGLNAPVLKSTDAEVISAVKNTPGAIGYVSTVPPGIRVVKKY